MIRASRRLDGVTTTIFAEMSALARRTGSINLGQGFPDTSGPEAVVERAVTLMRSGHNQYPPGHGSVELIDAVRRHQDRHYGLALTADQVVVTTGATEAIAAAILGLVDPGDEVVVLEPFYDSYRAMIQFAGGVRRAVTLRTPDFRLDLDAMEQAITPRTKLMLINSPHNPTGMVLNATEREGIARLARQHDLIVVCDEVYEHLTYGVEHVPLATLPGMAERTLTISSSGKSFSFTGWKIGWASGPVDLVAAVEGAKNWLTYASGAPFQPAIATALNEHADFPVRLAEELSQKRSMLCAALETLDVDVYRPDGTYFVLTDVSRLGDVDGHAFCLRLAQESGVVAIPAQVFYDDLDEGRHLVRWAFCKDLPILEEGIRRLRERR